MKNTFRKHRRRKYKIQSSMTYSKMILEMSVAPPPTKKMLEFIAKQQADSGFYY